jgi:hypothetical protein
MKTALLCALCEKVTLHEVTENKDLRRFSALRILR